MQSPVRSGSRVQLLNPLRIPHPKIDKLACQAQGVGIFTISEIPLCDATIYILMWTQRRTSYFAEPCEKWLKSAALESASHIPPEDRQARLSGAGCGYIRQRRNTLHDAISAYYRVIITHLSENCKRKRKYFFRTGLFLILFSKVVAVFFVLCYNYVRNY